MVRKQTNLTLLVTLLTLIALSCGGDSADDPPAPQDASYPQTIRQSDGQTLTLAAKPERIVSLSAHATEIFCAVGAEWQLVAVEQYANCPLDSSTKPALDGFQPNLEAIAGYRPDLVYIASNTGDVVQGLRRLTIPVLYLELPASVEEVLAHIRLLGTAAGHAGEAEALTGAMKSRMDILAREVSATDRGPRVFHELDNEYFTVAPDSFIGDFYTFLKAQNIAAGAAGAYPQLSAEVIIQRNPDVIVLADEVAGVTPASVRSRPGWDAIDAVKNNRICVIDPDIVSRPGPRIVDALEALAKCLYPDRFR
jgi:iron complex transport system substrate-binding protein